MTDKQIQAGVKHAAFVGLKALHGFKSAHGPARIAARVPYVGHVLGVAVLFGGAVAGAVSGFNEYDG
ncbi:hypothetical protein [Caulobacter sp. DWP3-1-3b2]|uniref:hypothetical protein n=1 Tax=Caulobacter sp. DWP3-1-3b2 TaxID=2804643 RepID=UPI003CF80279